MPYFTLHRNHVLRTTKGHSIGFVKGERTWVPPACVPDAVAIGAVSEDEIDLLPTEAAPAAPMSPDKRNELLCAAFDKLLLRNERGDFSASGLPNVAKLKELCGFEVTNRERDAAWTAYTAAKAEEQ
jgi:hypothetical protein